MKGPDSPPIFSVRVGGSVAELTAHAVDAERAGFDQIWTGNDIFGGPGIASMAAMLMATSTIKVGSGVLDPVSIHPAQLAQLASGLQELSGGRFILGLGAGSDIFFGWGGITPAKPVVRTREALLAVRALTEGRSPAGVPGVASGWREQAVIKRPHSVPLYVGAMGPRMLELTGRYADGALPLCLPPRHVFNVMQQLATGAEKSGRTLGDLDVAACIWCSIGSDEMEARHLLARHIAHYSGSLSVDALEANGIDPERFQTTQRFLDAGDEQKAIDFVLQSPSMLELGVVGGAREVIDQCTELISAGARHISFGPPMGPDPARAVELLGYEVLPVLRKTFAKN